MLSKKKVGSQYFENLPNCAYIIDKKGIVVDCNKKLLSKFKFNKKDIIGKSFINIYSPETHDKMRHLFKKLIEHGKLINKEAIISSNKRQAQILINANIIDKDQNLYIITQTDITTFKQTEFLLKESENKYRTIVEKATCGVAIIMDGLLKYLNPYLAKMLDYAADELLNTSYLKYIAPEERSIVSNRYRKRIAGKNNSSTSYETILLKKNGARIYTEFNIKMINFLGNPALIAIIRDITDQKQLENKLIASEKRFHDIFNTTGTAMLVVEKNMIISLVNKEFEKLSGYTRKQIEGKIKWPKFIEPSYLEKMVKYHHLRRINPRKIPRTYEFILIDKNRNKKNIFITVDLITATDKSIASLINITGKKKLEEENQLLATIVKQAVEGIAVIDFNYKLIFSNKAWAKMHGYKQRDLTGKKMNNFHTKKQFNDEFVPLLQKSQKTPVQGEVTHKKKDGSIFPAHMFVSQVKDKKNRAFAFVGFAIDITKQKKSEAIIKTYSQNLELANKELTKKNEQLQELDKLKTEFVSTASHEIRTPLTSIIGFAKTLQSKELELDNGARAKYLNIIESESKRLGILIEHLLDLTRFDTGESEFRYEDTDIFKLIQTAINSIKLPSNIIIKLDIQQNLRLFIDPEKIKQVIINIIDNAIKNIGKTGGKITFKAYKYKNLIKFSIKDTGAGIAKNELFKIFDKFYRTKAAIKEKQSGSGLGLAIVKTIIETHQGKIWAKSEPGKGTTFYFTIPEKIDQQIRNKGPNLKPRQSVS